MRQTLLALLLLALPATATQARKAATPRQQLLARLAKIQKRGYMYGHQDDTFYGLTWDWDPGRSDTRELVGDYPAVMGFDLGGLENGDRKNLDSVPFTRIREEIIAQHERGGIITVSWHPHNPVTNTTAWVAKDTTAYRQAREALCQLRACGLARQVPDPLSAVRETLPGGSRHELWMTWLARVTDFLLTLKDKSGQPIPIIVRPWHENNGGWFYWGTPYCTADEFLAFWRQTQDTLNKALPTSLVWAFSPNLHGAWTEQEWLSRYPGDDRVDVIGCDAYQWGTEKDYVRQLTADLDIISKIARERGKLLAMTECGYQNSPDATWWQRVFRPVIERYPVLYFLPWRNYRKDHFGASPDAKTAADFREWAGSKRFLFLNDIK